MPTSRRVRPCRGSPALPARAKDWTCCRTAKSRRRFLEHRREGCTRGSKAFGGTRHMIHSHCQHHPADARAGPRELPVPQQCILGCPFGAYFSTQSAMLPAAMKTGNLTLRPVSIVKEVSTTRTAVVRAAWRSSTPKQARPTSTRQGHLPQCIDLAADEFGDRRLGREAGLLRRVSSGTT